MQVYQLNKATEGIHLRIFSIWPFATGICNLNFTCIFILFLNFCQEDDDSSWYSLSGLPVTLMNFAKFMSTGPILTIKLIEKVSGTYFFFLFLNMGGQGALNFSKWRHDLFFNFLLNMEGPTPGGHSTLEVTGWSDRLETIPFTN